MDLCQDFLNPFFLENYCLSDYVQPPPNSYVEARTPDVTVSGDGAFGR